LLLQGKFEKFPPNFFLFNTPIAQVAHRIKQLMGTPVLEIVLCVVLQSKHMNTFILDVLQKLIASSELIQMHCFYLKETINILSLITGFSQTKLFYCILFTREEMHIGDPESFLIQSQLFRIYSQYYIYFDKFCKQNSCKIV